MSWLPDIGTHIKIATNDQILTGKVYRLIWDNKAALVVLDSYIGYYDPLMIGIDPDYPDGQGIFLLTPQVGWRKLRDAEVIQLQTSQPSNITEGIRKGIVKVVGLSHSTQNTWKSTLSDILFDTNDLDVSGQIFPFDDELGMMLQTRLSKIGKPFPYQIEHIEIEHLHQLLLLDRPEYHIINPWTSLNISDDGSYLHLLVSGRSIERTTTTRDRRWTEREIGWEELWISSMHTDDLQIIKEIAEEQVFICIQPSYPYLLWTVRRLLMAWFSNRQMHEGIVRIKVSNDPHSNNPRIIVYPKIGSDIALNTIITLFPANTGLGSNVPFGFNMLIELV